VPANLPASILTVEYAPFSTLLKHASAFVHHGGIGTLSQGFAAGVPQLVMHMAHDQPDNADRLERLGAGIGLSVRQFIPGRVMNTLQRLLGEAAFRNEAGMCARKVAAGADKMFLMSWIEQRMAK
jgi:rhamnosyltransferase subunit B